MFRLIQRWIDRRAAEQAENDVDRAYMEAQRNDILLLIDELDEKERQIKEKKRQRHDDHR